MANYKFAYNNIIMDSKINDIPEPSPGITTPSIFTTNALKSPSFYSKIIMICLYIVIIIFIPILLDSLFTWTVRARRRKTIMQLAEKTAILKEKSLVVFNGLTEGQVYHLESEKKVKSEPSLVKGEPFNGDFMEIIDQMADNSCVIIVAFVLEYVEDFEGALKVLKRVAGDNLYVLGLEANSPRTFWDYKIKQILDKSFYVPENLNVTSHKPNGIQLKLQVVYRYIFKVVPYGWFKLG
jgi:hypothetical protein